MRPLSFGAGMLVTSLAGPVAACDFCLISQGISPLETVNGNGIRVTQRYTRLGSVYDGEDEVPNPGAEESFYTTEIAGFWSPHPRVTLLGLVPVRVTRVDGHLAHGDDGHANGAETGHEEHAEDHDHDHGDHDLEVHDQHGGDEGIGDLSLLARVGVFERHTLTATTLVALTGGLKLPSGATDARGDHGEFLDAHVQLGTGSTDGLFGITVQHAWGRWSAMVNALAAIKGEGEAGDTDYEYGDALNYDANVRYRLQPAVPGASTAQTFASFGFSGELRDAEQQAGTTLAATGGHVVFLQPGVMHFINSRLIVEASAQVPVLRSVRDTQLTDDFKVGASLSWLF